LLSTSHTDPFAHSALDAQVVLHAPNAGSHTYGAQSNGVASSVGHASPAPAHAAAPTPVVVDVQRLGAHCVPFEPPMHAPSGPHVDRQLDPEPHS
jgi:hypothetical protein